MRRAGDDIGNLHTSEMMIVYSSVQCVQQDHTSRVQ